MIYWEGVAIDWSGAELATVALGDLRRDLRLMRIVDSLVKRPEQSLPAVFDSSAEVKAAYRFFENDAIEPQAILAAHASSTARRAREHSVVLVAQDTTEINLSDHPCTEGLGYLASPKCRGLLVHTALAISPTGVPLGVLAQRQWTRPVEELGKRHTRKQRETIDKESQRWIDGLHAVEAALGDHPQAIVIGDRESDFYDLFAAARRPNVHLLVRVCREQRRVEHTAKYLTPALESAPCGGRIEVSVPRSGTRPARRAKLDLRWLELSCKAPRQSKDPSVTLRFVLAQEVDVPAGEAPIRWFLATTLPVANLDDASRMIEYYVWRWRIERFHYTLKSGYLVEEQQFGTVDNVKRAVATLSIAAWRVLWLVTAARETPNLPCTVVLSAAEWQALYAVAHRGKRLPKTPPTLDEALRMIGRLGGHLGRKGDGPPGLKTIWRGLDALTNITIGWLAAQPPSPTTHLVGKG